MSHVKNYCKNHLNTDHFLTYADNYAIGYFKKQVSLEFFLFLSSYFIRDLLLKLAWKNQFGWDI